MQAGREIKFRYVFKHPKTKEVQTAIITIDDMERNDWSKTFKWDSLRFELVARQRYTGLRDKNGKEIYEGDIALIYGDRCVIEYDSKSASYVARTKIDSYWALDEETFKLGVEVIGNIYENPKLLEVGN